MVRVFVALAALVSVLVFAPTASAGSKVEYQVVSDGSLSTVVYFDGINDQQILSGAPASWSASVNNVATYPLYGVTAQTSGTQVSCQILVNGAVKDQKSAVGRYSVVNCTAL